MKALVIQHSVYSSGRSPQSLTGLSPWSGRHLPVGVGLLTSATVSGEDG